MSTGQSDGAPAVGESDDAPSVETGAGSPGRRIFGNFVALSATRPITWLATIGLTILLPRYLGDVYLGKINLAFAFADWCGLFASFGIAVWLAKEVARRREEAPSIALNALTLSMTLAVSVGVIGVVVATQIGFDPLTQILIYLLTAHMLLMVFTGVLIGALQGVQELRIVAVVDAVMKVSQVAMIAGVLLSGYGPVAVALAYIAADVLAVVWLVVAVRSRVGLQGPVRWKSWRGVLVGGMPLGIIL